MSKSETLTALAKALSTFQGAMRSIPKTSTNPFFHSKYADLDAVWEICRKPLSDNGFALIQITVGDSDKLYLETLLIHTSGEYISSLYPITPMRQTKDQGWVLSDDPQSIGSAITYARRYAMSAMLGLSAEEDDDAERAQNRSGRSTSRQTAAVRQPAPTTAQDDKPDWIAFWSGQDRAALHAYFDIEDRPKEMLLKAQALALLWKCSLKEAVGRMHEEYARGNEEPSEDPRGDPRLPTPEELQELML